MYAYKDRINPDETFQSAGVFHSVANNTYEFWVFLHVCERDEDQCFTTQTIDHTVKQITAKMFFDLGVITLL